MMQRVLRRMARSNRGRRLAHAVAARPLQFLLQPLRELNAKVGLCDVGARGGPAANLLGLAKQAALISFEGDAEEAARLRRELASWNLFAPDDLHVLGCFLGAPGDSRGRVHITAEPASSSLYRPVAQDFWPECERVFQVVAEHACDLVTLDAVLERREITQPIHYIKLDTQGSELDILKGATKALANALVLELEVEFNTMYQDQPLFADVDTWLREQGFVLWRLGRLVHYGVEGATSVGSTPLTVATDSRERHELVEGGQLVWADAYWVRRDVAYGRLENPVDVLAAALITRALGLRDLSDTVLRRHLTLFETDVARSIQRRLMPAWSSRQQPLPP